MGWVTRAKGARVRRRTHVRRPPPLCYAMLCFALLCFRCTGPVTGGVTGPVTGIPQKKTPYRGAFFVKKISISFFGIPLVKYFSIVTISFHFLYKKPRFWHIILLTKKAAIWYTTYGHRADGDKAHNDKCSFTVRHMPVGIFLAPCP